MNKGDNLLGINPEQFSGRGAVRTLFVNTGWQDIHNSLVIQQVGSFIVEYLAPPFPPLPPCVSKGVDCSSHYSCTSNADRKQETGIKGNRSLTL